MPAETPSPRFSLIHSMALVAAAAGSTWILQAQGLLGGWVALPSIFKFGPFFGAAAFAVLAPATIALSGLSLRRPRSTRSGLIACPGAVACFVASAAVASALAVTTWRHGASARGALQLALFAAGAEAVILAGLGVALCWGGLAAVGRWRAEPTWIDRAGRALGCTWIASTAYYLLIDHD